MALKNYGVLRGKVIDGKREDNPDSPHYQVHMTAKNIQYRIAVNVKSQMAPSELLFLVNETFQHPILTRLVSLATDFTPLPSKPDSMALDFIRSNLFSAQDLRLLPFNLPGQDNDLNDKIEHYVNRAKLDPDAELFAFGVRWGPEKAKDNIFKFKPGMGVHDIHMNQGNSGSFTSDDGVWQDGGLIFHFPKLSQWVAVFLAFQSQAWHTDDKTGHTITTPAPQPAPGQPIPAPAPVAPDAALHIVGAMVNPQGGGLEKETVILLNASPNAVKLDGWAITDKAKNRQRLSGTISPAATMTVAVKPPVQLGNSGGTITLLDPSGLKIDGVSYTAAQAGKEGWVIVF